MSIPEEKDIVILPYSYEKFCEIVDNIVTEHFKPQFPPNPQGYPLKYFKSYLEYFQSLGPITMVLERHYIDHYFMEDYAAYYVRCFPGTYSPVCARIHFFNTDFDEALFNKTLIEQNPQPEKYLGYTVIKRLPQTFVGRTCLKTYNPEGGRRYPVVYKTQAHMSGFTLPIESIPFQQQDTVVAACATSALWSVFHGTGMLFHHHIPSPAEITRMATKNSASLGRGFPSRGLTMYQMSDVIRSLDLEPEFIEIQTKYHLQSLVYGYLEGGVPIVLLASLYDKSESDESLGGPKHKGFHAVAITGYCNGHSTLNPLPNGTVLRSSRINKLYVHDDQIGPFAKLEFIPPEPIYQKGCRVIPKGNINVARWFAADDPPIMLKSSWPNCTGEESIVFVPEAVIIPLYHKIRIPLKAVLTDIMEFDCGLRNKHASLKNLEWEVFLTTTEDLKSDIRRRYTSRLPDNEILSLLHRPLPRFIWRAIVYIGDSEVLEYWFDATNVEQGDYLLQKLLIDKGLLS